MTPHELRVTLDRLDLSAAEAGHLLGVHRATIYRWLDGSPLYLASMSASPTPPLSAYFPGAALRWSSTTATIAIAAERNAICGRCLSRSGAELGGDPRRRTEIREHARRGSVADARGAQSRPARG
jgi:hypothetical protein